ncbi:hypothetical protein EDB89DRAFT_1904243 [Lactarius sanguifluus]|nr:hypothetical protein EDB89DRAFT_1904243 [Lactarius sanguifluus]
MTATVTTVVVVATVGETSSPLYHFPASNPMKKKRATRAVCAPNNVAATRVHTNASWRMMAAELYKHSPSMCAANDDYDGKTMTAMAADIPPTQPMTTMTRVMATITEQGKDNAGAVVLHVTFGPAPDPPAPRWKTPNTAVKQSRAEYAEEEVAVARLVAENLAQDPYRAKSPTTYYRPLSTQEPQKYWE